MGVGRKLVTEVFEAAAREGFERILREGGEQSVDILRAKNALEDAIENGAEEAMIRSLKENLETVVMRNGDGAIEAAMNAYLRSADNTSLASLNALLQPRTYQTEYFGEVGQIQARELTDAARAKFEVNGNGVRIENLNDLESHIKTLDESARSTAIRDLGKAAGITPPASGIAPPQTATAIPSLSDGVFSKISDAALQKNILEAANKAMPSHQPFADYADLVARSSSMTKEQLQTFNSALTKDQRTAIFQAAPNAPAVFENAVAKAATTPPLDPSMLNPGKLLSEGDIQAQINSSLRRLNNEATDYKFALNPDGKSYTASLEAGKDGLASYPETADFARTRWFWQIDETALQETVKDKTTAATKLFRVEKFNTRIDLLEATIAQHNLSVANNSVGILTDKNGILINTIIDASEVRTVGQLTSKISLDGPLEGFKDYGPGVVIRRYSVNDANLPESIWDKAIYIGSKSNNQYRPTELGEVIDGRATWLSIGVNAVPDFFRKRPVTALSSSAAFLAGDRLLNGELSWTENLLLDPLEMGFANLYGTQYPEFYQAWRVDELREQELAGQQQYWREQYWNPSRTSTSTTTNDGGSLNYGGLNQGNNNSSDENLNYDGINPLNIPKDGRDNVNAK